MALDSDNRFHHFPSVLREQLGRHWRALEDTGQVAWLSGQMEEQLMNLWAVSPQAAHWCLRDPGILQDWADEHGTPPAIDFLNYADEFALVLSTIDQVEDAKRELRRLRNREMVRILWRDVNHLDDLDETLLALSTLADALIQVALDWLTPRHAERFGYARNADGEIQQLAIIGMGKLGGQELNFSSDIDLIFAFEAPGETDGTRVLSNEDYFRRLAQDLVNLLNENTPDGFVFRVDTRLRPFGSSGPLVMHLGALESYYQTHGREWERYAWIKARPVAGDIRVGEALLDSLQPFIYRRYLDYGAFDAMRDMKGMIEQQIKRKGLTDNIKLGAGGIREVEFIAQVFQLIHGGRHLELRNRSLRKVLPALVTYGFLSEDSAEQLDRSYVFLRQLENRIQGYADQQTHELPAQDHARVALALAMGYPGWHELNAAVYAFREHVHEQFEKVFLAPQTETVPDDPHAELMDIWQETLPEDAAVELLAREGYEEANAVLEQLSSLRESTGFLVEGDQSRRRLDRCIVLLLAAASAHDKPDVVFERLLKVVRSIAGRSSYIALLVENPTALSQLVRLCAASPWITAQLTQSPMLLDSLLDSRQLYSPLLKEGLRDELASLVRQAPDDDLEQQMNLLRRFKQTAVLRVAAADVSEAMPLMVVSDRLTDIAEVVVEHALAEAWKQTVEKHGEPRLDASEVAGLLVVAYGKFGGIELGYGSDLDLVFVHDGKTDANTDGERPVSHEVFFARLGQRIIHWLNTYTPAGRAYEVDMRLRPNGESGLLVTSIDALENYQINKAWIWEHQALVRARPVAGKESLVEKFLKLREKVLMQRREEDELCKAVVDMRRKMRLALEEKEAGKFDLKQGIGGIADIEFIVQYNVLLKAREYPQLIEFPDNIRILEQLSASGLWRDEEANVIAEAYRNLRRETHRLALQETPKLIDDNLLVEEREKVQRCWVRQLPCAKGG